MRLKLFLQVSLAVSLLFSAVYPSFSQVVPAAYEGMRLPLTAGLGLSSFSPDWLSGRLMGGTLWIDYNPTWVPQRLYGIGLEVEGRDLRFNRSSSQPSDLREDTAGGGVIYTWRRYRQIRPYGKFLMGLGNVDYLTGKGARYNTGRTVTFAGGGLEYDAFRRFWVRADYEYQWWPDFFNVNTPNPGKLDPQGITVGVSYHFNQRSSH
jgi:opacity protein-like surface antigen